MFIAKTECYFGADRYEDLASNLASTVSGVGVALIDSALAKHPSLMSVLDDFRSATGAEVEPVLVKIADEPTYDQLDRLASDMRVAQPSFILAIGGGSLLDLSKGVSVLLENPGTGRDYRGMGLVRYPPRPLIAVPTTAGTGSEVTWTASFIDDETRIKLGINGPNVFPRAALLEPRLLVGSPRSIAVSAALDALVHAVESVTSPQQSAPSTALAVKAVDLVTHSLVPALSEDCESSWSNVQVGAYLAGLAMLNSSGGVASGVSYPIGATYRVPHGWSGGIPLLHVVQWNSRAGYPGYEIFMNAGVAVGGFASRLTDLYDELGVPSDFASWGIQGKSAADTITALTLEQRQASLSCNPISFGPHDLESLVRVLCPTP